MADQTPLTDDNLTELESVSTINGGLPTRLINRLIADLRARQDRINHALAIHKRSLSTVPFGRVKDHYCLGCWMSVENYSHYVRYPCRTAKALGATDG